MKRWWVLALFVAILDLSRLMVQVDGWMQLNVSARCWNDYCPPGTFPGSFSCNCRNDRPHPRRGHSSVNNGTHLFYFGGQIGVFHNNSINQEIGEVPPVLMEAQELAGIINYTRTRIALAQQAGCGGSRNGCWARGDCSFDQTCQCDARYFGEDCSLVEELEFMDDLWILDFHAAQWIRLPRETRPLGALWPSSRTNPSMVMVGKRIIMYGGYSAKCVDYCADLWEFVTEPSMVPSTNFTRPFMHGVGWRLLADPIPPGRRWRHTALYYERINAMLIYGGHRYGGGLGDVWTMDLDTYVWTQRLTGEEPTPSPGKRLGHAASIYQDKLYIYGGYRANINLTNETPSLSDFWFLDLISWNWTKIHGHREFGSPFPRQDMHAIVAKPTAVSHYLSYYYMFGGYYDNRFYNDLWQYNFTRAEWKRARVPGRLHPPHVRGLFSMDYLAPSNTIVVTGGHGSLSSGIETYPVTYFNDVWYFDLERCPQSTINDLECSGHGICEHGVCTCDVGYFDDDCSMRICPDDICGFKNFLPSCIHCSGRGNCSAVDGTCKCKPGYSGYKCTQTVCTNNNCSFTERGDCVDRFPNHPPYCKCFPEFLGGGCELVSCPKNCSGHGVCLPEGDCVCDTRVFSGFVYTGTDCSTYIREEELNTGFRIRPVFSVLVICGFVQLLISKLIRLPLLNI